MAQLSQRLRFDLTDALARHLELAPNFLQRSAASVLQPEAQAQDLALPVGEAVEHVHHLFLEQLMRCRVRWSERLRVLDEVA